MRLVLDTCVIVSAFRSRTGASRALVDAFDLNKFDLLLSTSLLLEYETVLDRPEHRNVHGYTPDQLAKVVDTMAARATRVSLHYQYHPLLRDPFDEHVLSTAINGNADSIITHNVSDFLPAARNFGIQIQTPGRIIRERFST